MPIDFSTMSPEDVMLLQSTDFLPDLGTLSTTQDGLLNYATNPALENAERPNWFQRLVRAGSLLYDAMNYGGERAAAGDAARAAGMLRLFGDSPLARRQSDLANELLESARVNGNQGIEKSLGQISGTIPISTEQTIGDTLGLALSAFGLRDAGKAAGQAIGSLPSWYRAGRAASTLENASPAIRQLRDADALYKAASELSPTATGDVFADITNLSRVYPEAARVARPTVAKIMRYGRKIVENDPSSLIGEQTRRQAEIAETARLLQRQGLLDEETGKTLTKMFNEVGERYAPEIARRQATLAKSGPAFKGQQTRAMNDFGRQYAFGVDAAHKYAASMGNDALNNPALVNAPWNVGASTPADVLHNFAKLGEQEQTYRTIARDALAKASGSLDNAAQTISKTAPAILAGEALGDIISDLPYNPEAEARLAEVASSKPTSLKPTSTDTDVLTKTDAPTATDSPTTTVDGIYDTMDFSHAGIPDSYPSSPTDIVNARPSSSDDGTIPVTPMLTEYQKRLREATEATKKEQKKLIKAYEGLRNMQAMDPYQWETRVLLERQLLDAEKRAANSYRDDSWNKIGAILTAPLTARRLENPFEVWERNVQGAVDRDPEVRRLRRLLGYTEDLPSGSDRAKSEQSIIEQVSKVNFDLINASLKEQQAMLEAAMAFNSNVSEERKKRAEARLREAQTKREEEETKYVEELSKAKINYYNKGGYRGIDPTAISSFLNQGATGASPL